ncbi:hypothetical protein HPB52_007780 [Rhipicephalus sanguineus]|uniref:glutathione transferase n=2 Tax=Rhipicephalus sanguineus TaxID=34632 RepID=A0A9D4PUY9_RHISA|nr:hypothetical protein HPB52_007780 [Rhipicephalus sanguineus]
MKPLLAYWNIRSLGQPLRNLLIYKGVEFEDKRYPHGPPPEYSREAWLREKFTLGFPFPNIPYYVDDDVKITQSVAILRYLGRKHDLAGRDDQETTELDVLEQQARDMFLAIPYQATNVPGCKGGLEWYAENMGYVLEPWEKHLSDNKWALGDRLTYVDFMLYEGFDWHREFKPDAMEPYPNIAEYLKRFEELPNIKEFFASDKYNRWPILGPMRPWGNRK